MRDIIVILEREANHAPSGAAWRRIDDNNIVSVKCVWVNSYTWYHNGTVIAEGKASNLLKDVTK